MGNGGDLSLENQRILVEGLRRHPTTVIFLAFHGEHPAGILVGFVGFSTFMARPLINIHDFYVEPAFRRQGIGRLLLQAVEDKARELGCCKLTLEAQQHNQSALSLYHRFGFEEAQYDQGAGVVLFRQKKL
jgi:ribosomal protein S18 acetylase RimI-like enzyme